MEQKEIKQRGYDDAVTKDAMELMYSDFKNMLCKICWSILWAVETMVFVWIFSWLFKVDEPITRFFTWVYLIVLLIWTIGAGIQVLRQFTQNEVDEGCAGESSPAEDK